MRTFHRRAWDEKRGDAHDDWGSSIWYFEVEDGQAFRQVEMYQSGNVLKYTPDFLDDEFGALADQPIDCRSLRPAGVADP